MNPKQLTRAQAIKKYCRENCCAGDLKSWQNCQITQCFLWKFRKGVKISDNSKSFSKTMVKQGVFERKNDFKVGVES